MTGAAGLVGEALPAAAAGSTAGPTGRQPLASASRGATGRLPTREGTSLEAAAAVAFPTAAALRAAALAAAPTERPAAGGATGSRRRAASRTAAQRRAQVAGAREGPGRRRGRRRRRASAAGSTARSRSTSGAAGGPRRRTSRLGLSCRTSRSRAEAAAAVLARASTLTPLRALLSFEMPETRRRAAAQSAHEELRVQRADIDLRKRRDSVRERVSDESEGELTTGGRERVGASAATGEGSVWKRALRQDRPGYQRERAKDELSRAATGEADEGLRGPRTRSRRPRARSPARKSRRHSVPRGSRLSRPSGWPCSPGRRHFQGRARCSRRLRGGGEASRQHEAARVAVAAKRDGREETHTTRGWSVCRCTRSRQRPGRARESRRRGRPS